MCTPQLDAKTYETGQFFGGVFPAQCRVLLDKANLIQELQALFLAQILVNKVEPSA